MWMARMLRHRSRFSTMAFETKSGSSASFPTSETKSRGDVKRLWVGVALSVLGGNTGSLVGVAISASLLPPAVNCRLLFAYALFGTIFPHVIHREQKWPLITLDVSEPIILPRAKVAAIQRHLTSIMFRSHHSSTPHVSSSPDRQRHLIPRSVFEYNEAFQRNIPSNERFHHKKILNQKELWT